MMRNFFVNYTSKKTINFVIVLGIVHATQPKKTKKESTVSIFD